MSASKQILTKLNIGDGLPIKLHENSLFESYWAERKKKRNGSTTTNGIILSSQKQIKATEPKEQVQKNISMHNLSQVLNEIYVSDPPVKQGSISTAFQKQKATPPPEPPMVIPSPPLQQQKLIFKPKAVPLPPPTAQQPHPFFASSPSKSAQPTPKPPVYEQPFQKQEFKPIQILDAPELQPLQSKHPIKCPVFDNPNQVLKSPKKEPISPSKATRSHSKEKDRQKSFSSMPSSSSNPKNTKVLLSDQALSDSPQHVERVKKAKEAFKQLYEKQMSEFALASRYKPASQPETLSEQKDQKFKKLEEENTDLRDRLKKLQQLVSQLMNQGQPK